MVYIGLFFFELVLLFFLSRELTKSLSTILFRLTKSQTATIHILSFLFLPGVIIHELAHMLVASVLFVPVGEIEFFPKITEAGVKLGSVSIAKTDPVRRALIGAAPVFVGLSILLGILFYFDTLHTGGESFIWWMILIAGYAVFEIGNTMFSSHKDMEGTLELFGAIGLIGIVLYGLGIRIDISSILGVLTTEMVLFIQKADVFLSLPIVIDVFLWGIVKLLHK